MKSTHVVKKVIWAIDPFEEAIKSRSQLIEALKHISKEQKAVVEPVHVLDFSLKKEAFKLEQSEYERYKYAAKKATEDALKDVQGIELLPPRILMVEDSSPKTLVQELINHAVASDALLIVVGTHGRRGLQRLFMGSFAETLLLYSNVPVVSIGPECRNSSLQNKILFASRLDERSTKNYERVLKFAKVLNAEITLFHVVSHGIEPVLQSGAYLLGGGWVETPEYLSEKEDRSRKIANQWATEAQGLGIKVKVQIESEGGPISDLVIKHASSHNFGWIAMSAESGIVSSALVGSITRQILRQSPCPMFVLRSQDDVLADAFTQRKKFPCF